MLLKSFITAVHLAALSQIESGDHDRMTGADHEISRYQILPAVWNAAVAKLPQPVTHHHQPATPANPAFADAVAREIWQDRVDVFRMAYGRDPSLTELYLCWHRPARVMNPKPRELLRARRFENLVKALEQKQTKGTNP